MRVFLLPFNLYPYALFYKLMLHDCMFYFSFQSGLLPSFMPAMQDCSVHCEFYARVCDACSCIHTSVYIEVFEKNIEDIINILRRRCSCSFCRRTPGPLHLFLPTAKEKQVLSMTINKTPVVKTSENEAHSIYLQYKQAPFRNVAFFSPASFPLRKKKCVFI